MNVKYFLKRARYVKRKSTLSTDATTYKVHSYTYTYNVENKYVE